MKYQKDQTFNPYFRIAYTKDRHMSTRVSIIWCFLFHFLTSLTTLSLVCMPCHAMPCTHIPHTRWLPQLGNYCSTTVFRCLRITQADRLKEATTHSKSANNRAKSHMCRTLMLYLIHSPSPFSSSHSPISLPISSICSQFKFIRLKSVQNMHSLLCVRISKRE